MKKIQNRITLCILFLVSLPGALFAGNEIYNNRLSAFTGTLIQGARLRVTDGKLNSIPSINIADKVVKNKITLGIDYECTTAVPAFSNLQVALQITWRDLSSSHSATTTLSVYYDPAANTAVFTDKNTFAFQGGYDVSISIISIKNASGANITPPKNVYLESEIGIERYYKLDGTIIPASTSISHTPIMLDADAFADEIDIHWDFIQGAEEYELEWTYANDYSGTSTTNYIAKASLTSKYDFKNNATHIKTQSNSYRIPLVYEHGYILYRYRAVGRSLTSLNQFVYGQWSAAETGPVNTFPNYYPKTGETASFQPHQNAKNWQYSAAYLEQGIKSEGVTYLDGTLKDHQSVSKMNSSQQVLVSEKIYDYVGRPAINVLPAPGGNTVKFYENFNQNTLGTPFKNSDFDLDIGNCQTQKSPMSNASGASNYYSTNNPNKANENAFIPDAGGYPYVQTEFTPDNTGRVKRQSGLGPDYKMDSGHETINLYAEPFQEELDRLFGSDVGDCSHYKKTVSIDGNGQASVAYMNMEGKTIATGLIGDNPATMDAIPNGSFPLVVDMFSKDGNGVSKLNAVQSDRRSINFAKDMIAEKDGTYKFDYDVTAPAYTDNCLTNMCMDCIYDLELSVKDECGSEQIPAAQRTARIGKVALNTDCDNPLFHFPSAPSSISLSLKKGLYAVSKKLKINEDAFKYYVDQYTDTLKNSCIKKYSQYVQEEYTNIDTSNCHIVCTTCPGAATAASATQAGFNMLLSDVSPGGQYGLCYDASGNVVSTDPLSVYNITNQLPGNSGSLKNWKHPQVTNLSNGLVANSYYEADGSPSKIQVSLVGGVYVPAISISPHNLNDGYGNFVFPEELSNVSDFISYWRPSWAKSLVEYHPEFGYYKWNWLNNQAHYLGRTSDEFDYYMTSTMTYADAVTKGLLSSDPMAADPYFHGGLATAAQVIVMSGKLSTYINDQNSGTIYSMKEYAALTNRCGSCFGGVLPSVTPGCTDFGGGGAAPADVDIRNREWNAYKSAYLNEKTKLKNVLADNYTLNTRPSFNGCIGSSSFDPLTSKMAAFSGSTSDPNQACNATNYSLYKSKIKRFRTGNDVMDLGVDVNENPKDALAKLKEKADLEIYKATGQCPMASQVKDLLDGLLGGHTLNAVQALYNFPQFTKDMYDVLNTSYPSNQYTWSGSFSGKQMNGSFFAEDGTLAGGLNLNFSSSSSYSFSSIIVKFEQLKFTTQIGTTYNFTVLAWINVSGVIVKEEISGSTILPVGNCQFKESCHLSASGKDFLKMFSFLAFHGDIANSTSPDFSTSPYNTYMTNNIKVFLGNGPWSATVLSDPAGYFSLAIINTTTNVGIQMKAKTTDGQPLDFIHVKGFSSMTDLGNGAMAMTAILDDGSTRSLDAFYNIRGTYQFNDCGVLEPQNPPACTGSNLVINGSFDGTGNTGVGTTGFVYNPTCPNEDEYTISSEIYAQCGVTGSTYYDHTNPGVSKYLFANTPLQGPTTKVVWEQTVTVQPKTSYLFTAWANQIVSKQADRAAVGGSEQSRMNVYLTVNDKILPATLVYPYYKQEWRKLQDLWYSGNNTTVSLKIVIENQYQNLSHLFVDDISFIGGCETDTLPILDTVHIPHRNPCVKYKMDLAKYNAKIKFDKQLADVRATFEKAYIDKCLFPAENFTEAFADKEYYFTLYYYDRAGNLVKTVPPAGVVPVTATSDFTLIKNDRKNGTHVYLNTHSYITNYKYNTLNQLTQQTTPDGGITNFWYDAAGRLVLTQNAKQAVLISGKYRYSYTLYDKIGRVKEVGEVANATASTGITSVYLNDALFPVPSGSGNTKSQLTITNYDTQTCPTTLLVQQNLRGKVAGVKKDENADGVYEYATHYSYDTHGNVSTLIQDLPGLSAYANNYKRIDYEYDLVSGNLNALHYQTGAADEFHHRYEYDADNRLSNVYTSRDNITWDQDAKYFYYMHGPLSRTEIGHNKVQGSDYAYTLQGWLKGVNSNTLNTSRDIGGDGLIKQGVNANIPADEFGFTLGYNSNDYTAISSTAAAFQATAPNTSDFYKTMSSLYNGNIAQSVVAVKQLMQNNTPPQGTDYQYDQLNRLKQVSVFNDNQLVTSNSWKTTSASNGYREYFTYDNNGNLSSATRNGGNGLPIDNITYKYLNVANGFTANTNRLMAAQDPLNGNVGDIQPGQVFSNSNILLNNYGYDETGNLTRDDQEQIQAITWNVYGKVTSVTRTSTSTKSDLEFQYDALGNRVCKIVKPRTSSGLSNESKWIFTYYLRDASGNLLCTYQKAYNAGLNSSYTGILTQNDISIFGSSRVGTYQDGKQVSSFTFTSNSFDASKRFVYTTVSLPVTPASNASRTQAAWDHKVGQKQYELTNHLGNVLATVSDKKFAVDDRNTLNLMIPDGKVDYYKPLTTKANLYYAYGMMQSNPNNLNANAYRFGFNGMEKDDEKSGVGNSYDFGARLYDPRLGRFLAVDPLAKVYTWQSPFSYVRNNPIFFIDFEGEGDPLARMQIRENRASNMMGKVRTDDGKINIKNHQGYDLAAPVGTTIFAVKDAVVFKVIHDLKGDYGNQIILKITDKNGVITYAFYAHLSCMDVNEGDKVVEYQPIGQTGMTGNAKNLNKNQAHLHFELRNTGKALGKGLEGRMDPNIVLDTKFYSSDIRKRTNQTLTGVYSCDPSECMERMKPFDANKRGIDYNNSTVANPTNSSTTSDAPTPIQENPSNSPEGGSVEPQGTNSNESPLPDDYSTSTPAMMDDGQGSH